MSATKASVQGAGSDRPLRKAAFLDRDGVINIDHGYVHRWEDFEFVPGAVEAMKRLHEMGYLLIVVTNQSGIARGMYTEEDFQALTLKMVGHLAAAGVPIASVQHCPHHPDGSVPQYAVPCACRKPQPGMLIHAAAAHGLDLHGSLLVGDKADDVEAAFLAGVPTFFQVASHASRQEMSPRVNTLHADLAEVASILVSARA